MYTLMNNSIPPIDCSRNRPTSVFGKRTCILLGILGLLMTGCALSTKHRIEPDLKEDPVIEILSTKTENGETTIDLEIKQPVGDLYAIVMNPTVVFDDEEIVYCQIRFENRMRLLRSDGSNEVIASEEGPEFGNKWDHASMHSYYHRSYNKYGILKNKQLLVEMVWIPDGDYFTDTERRSRSYRLTWSDPQSSPEIEADKVLVGEQAIFIDSPDYDNDQWKVCEPVPAPFPYRVQETSD